MEKQQPLLRRVYSSLFFEVQVNQWSPPYRNYTIAQVALSVAILASILLIIFTDSPGLGVLTALLFLASLAVDRLWLRSILRQEGQLPPDR